MLTHNHKKIYLIGIKGAGMSSLAVILKKMGYQVTGSDTAEKFFTESQLYKNKIKFFEDFDPENITQAQPDLVIFSTAYNSAGRRTHPEIAKAKILNLETISYPEAIGWISEHLISIAISGSHGKTTTTSMLGSIMQSNNQTLTLTGTVADQLKNEVKNPKYFVFEADEYQNKFQYYNPHYFVLTNIDFDHPDFFKSKKHYNQIFQDFVQKILTCQGFVLYNDSIKFPTSILRHRKSLDKKGHLLSYGFHPNSDYQIRDINSALHQFSVYHLGKKLLQINLKVYGKHNILNASAAAIMALQLGIPTKAIQKELNRFSGVKRRMELILSKKYIIIDDYGHHPTEIQATLAAVRNHYPKQNIVAVFHPHTFTRTKALLKDFGKSFKDANLTIVLDIYGSARESASRRTSTIHARDVVAEIKKNGAKAIHQPTIKETAEYIKKSVPKGSVILTIGAGDVWKLTELIK